jgi:hypothetical protein
MYLTNDASAPTKWQVPTGVTIPAGGYLLFWADANSSAGSRHASFTLAAAGGTVALYDIDGITRIDTVTYGAQTTNVSWGRYPNGSGSWQALTTITPEGSNGAPTNLAPTDIALSSASIAENLPSGTTIGTLTTTDPNSGDSFTYSLASGLGSSDNDAFSVSGGTLLSAASFDYETKSSYSIRLRSTDSGGLSVEKPFTITVTNVNEAPAVTLTARAPSAPSSWDTVRVTSRVTDDSSVGSVILTYLVGSGTPTTTTVFTETMCSTAVKPWTGTGAVNPWTVTGSYCEQRTGSNYGTGNVCGMEYKGGTTLNALTSSMVATTNGIDATGASGYLEFWVQTLTLDGTDGWTFQVDSGSGFVTRLSELTGSSHAWQKYHYDLASSELVSGLKLRFQFTGGGTADDDRIDLDFITLTTTSAGAVGTTVTMYDDGSHGDGSAGDHLFGGLIPAMPVGTTVRYYVTAADALGLTTVDPSAAPATTYSYTVTQLSPPPVADGKLSGTAARFSEDATVAGQIDVTWGVAACSTSRAVVLRGAIGNFAGYTGCAQSEAGDTGSTTIDGSAIGDVWFNVVWTSGTTGGHPGYGFDGSADVERAWNAAGFCSLTADDHTDKSCN